MTDMLSKMRKQVETTEEGDGNVTDMLSKMRKEAETSEGQEESFTPHTYTQQDMNMFKGKMAIRTLCRECFNGLLFLQDNRT